MKKKSYEQKLMIISETPRICLNEFGFIIMKIYKE